MVIVQTTLDLKAMTALARVTRKTLRRGRKGPVRMLAWFVVAAEAFLTWVYIRGGQDGWLTNVLLGLIMLAAILGEDPANGLAALRRIPPGSREVNTTFSDESCYICRSQSGESWLPYQQIKAACETRDYFVILMDRNQGQVFDKKGLTWGTAEELRELIRKKTGLKMQTIR